MQIHPAIIDLLFHENGATEAEFAKVADNWIEQVESLMVSNEIERFMKDGKLRLKWKV